MEHLIAIACWLISSSGRPDLTESPKLVVPILLMKTEDLLKTR